MPMLCFRCRNKLAVLLSLKWIYSPALVQVCEGEERCFVLPVHTRGTGVLLLFTHKSHEELQPHLHPCDEDSLIYLPIKHTHTHTQLVNFNLTCGPASEWGRSLETYSMGQVIPEESEDSPQWPVHKCIT